MYWTFCQLLPVFAGFYRFFPLSRQKYFLPWQKPNPGRQWIIIYGRHVYTCSNHCFVPHRCVAAFRTIATLHQHLTLMLSIVWLIIYRHQLSDRCKSHLCSTQLNQFSAVTCCRLHGGLRTSGELKSTPRYIGLMKAWQRDGDCMGASCQSSLTVWRCRLHDIMRVRLLVSRS